MSTALKCLAISGALLVFLTLTVQLPVFHGQTCYLSIHAVHAEEPDVIPIPGYKSYPEKDWDSLRRIRENPISKQEHMLESVLINELFSSDWMLLATQEQVGWHELSNLQIGNFDSNSQLEILFRVYEGDKIVGLDGRIRNFELPENASDGMELIIDYDNDGRDDFAVETKESQQSDDDSDSYEFSVFNFRNELIGNLNLSHGQFFRPVIADFDGDSSDDHNAVLIRTKEYPARAVPSESLMIEIVEDDGQDHLINCTGDIDGDGKDELLVSNHEINGDIPGHTLWAFGVDGQSTLLETPSGEFASKPYFCCDLNNDGTDEIFMSEYYTDIVNQSVVRMEWPYTMQFPFMHGDDLAQFELNRTKYMAATPQFLADGAVSLAIWAEGGKLIYYHQFGEIIQSMRKVQYEGRDRLLVLTGTRLMMSP